LIAFLVGAYRTWFSDELETVLGVPLGKSSCHPPKSVERLSGEGVEVLLYRVEDMHPDAPAHSALLAQASEFLGVPISALPKLNTAATRRSFERYDAARRLLRLAKPTLDAIYGHPIVSRFYSASEVDAFKAKWSQ